MYIHVLTAAAVLLARGGWHRHCATGSISEKVSSSSICLLACEMKPREALFSLARNTSFSLLWLGGRDDHWPSARGGEERRRGEDERGREEKGGRRGREERAEGDRDFSKQ